MTEKAVTPIRERRLSLNNIAPSASNGWTGSVNATIAESFETIVFSFVTPELSDRDARAIVAGYAARIAIAASGKKTPAEISAALNAEIKVLEAGTYTIRGGTGMQSSFTDTIISLGLLKAYPEVNQVACNFTKEDYDQLLAKKSFLSVIQAEWDAADEAGKKAMVTSAVAKTKRLVAFFKM